MAANLKYNHPDYSDKSLNESLFKILLSNTLMSVAVVDNGCSYIFTAYYVYNSDLDFYFITDPSSHHVSVINKNHSVALAVYDSHQSWDNNKSGLQIFGSCREATAKSLIEGTVLYLKRFTGLQQWVKHPDDFIKGAINSKMFVVKTEWLKLFDEDVFGEENFITLKMERGK